MVEYNCFKNLDINEIINVRDYFYKNNKKFSIPITNKNIILFLFYLKAELKKEGLFKEKIDYYLEKYYYRQ